MSVAHFSVTVASSTSLSNKQLALEPRGSPLEGQTGRRPSFYWGNVLKAEDQAERFKLEVWSGSSLRLADPDPVGAA